MKRIKGYEDYYVTTCGKVISIKRGKVRILKPSKDNRGYMGVFLYKEGKRLRCNIHRLVAEAYLPNMDNLPQVNHKDEVQYNNVLSNLEWVSARDNIRYSKAKRIVRSDGKIYEAMVDVIADGFSRSCVSMCCNGSLGQHKGYTWKFLDI